MSRGTVFMIERIVAIHDHRNAHAALPLCPIQVDTAPRGRRAGRTQTHCFTAFSSVSGLVSNGSWSGGADTSIDSRNQPSDNEGRCAPSRTGTGFVLDKETQTAVDFLQPGALINGFSMKTKRKRAVASLPGCLAQSTWRRGHGRRRIQLRLGRQALSAGLGTLDLARIHEHALS